MVEILRLSTDVPPDIRNDSIPPGPERQSIINQIRHVTLEDCNLMIRRTLPNGIPISFITFDLRFAVIGPDDTEFPYIYEPSIFGTAEIGAIPFALPETQRTIYHSRDITRADRTTESDQSRRPLTDWTFTEHEAQTARILVVHAPSEQWMADLAEALKRYQQNYCRFTS